MMGRRSSSATLLTFITLTCTWINISKTIPTNLHTQTNNTAATAAVTNRSSLLSFALLNANSNSSQLSNSQALELLLAAYLTGRIRSLNISESSLSPQGIQPALLDYENETEVEDLEKIVANQTEGTTDIELPPDVYEVPLVVWINEERASAVTRAPVTEQSSSSSEDEAQLIISELLRAQTTEPSPHAIRHRSRRVARRHQNGQRSRSNTLPLETADNGNILNLLRRQQQNNNGETSRPLELLRKRPSFNMTVDYQAPFENIDSNKLLEIVLIMRSDCTQLPNNRKRMVKWVSGMRGILFECQNGAWVVTYLSRRNRKPGPVSVTDCHELHLQGLRLQGAESPRHQLVIHYSNGDRKSTNVMCKHDDRHSNHQLIDNYINADPNQPVLPVIQTIAGAWTVIQRRVNGGTKFYRSMKRYKRGFGSVESGEYWLGLEALHEATHTRDYMLRVEVTSGDNMTYYSEYNKFRVGSEAKSYRLRLGAFIEPINGTLSSGDFLTLHHGGRFHTRDSDKFSVNCAKLYGTAFWFRGCWAAVNLNGPYISSDINNSGIRWATSNPNEVRRVWKTEMMMKPIL